MPTEELIPQASGRPATSCACAPLRALRCLARSQPPQCASATDALPHARRRRAAQHIHQGGRFRVWCICSGGSGGDAGAAPSAVAPRSRTLLVRVDDYAPVIYINAPQLHDTAPAGAGDGAAAPRELQDRDLSTLTRLLNSR